MTLALLIPGTGMGGGTAAVPPPAPAGAPAASGPAVLLDPSLDYLVWGLRPGNAEVDYTVWDNVEAVTLEIPGRVGTALDAAPVAKRRALHTAERSPTGGVYLAADTRWILPAALLTGGSVPAPGWVVIDGDGVRWTALKVQAGKWRQTYILDTIDLVLALGLRETVTVERASISYGAAGAAVKRWPTGPGPNGGTVPYSLPASVQLLTDEVADQRGIRGFLGNYAVTVGKQIAVTNEDRVRWQDNTGAVHYLDVRGYHNATQLGELPVLDCELRP